MSITAHQHLNGVDTTTLFATIDAVRQQPEAAKFQFRTDSEWVSGNHSRGRFPGFFGAGQEHVHAGDTVIEADHPTVLVGTDLGPTPAELLLNALASCLMAGLGNIAAARGVELHGLRQGRGRHRPARHPWSRPGRAQRLRGHPGDLRGRRRRRRRDAGVAGAPVAGPLRGLRRGHPWHQGRRPGRSRLTTTKPTVEVAAGSPGRHAVGGRRASTISRG